tara:strand:+ start:1516 stop:1992 length:477 start_codon:yes stop_codon:yes gene_type:complete
MVNRLKIIIVTFAFVIMVVRNEKTKTYNGIGLEKADAAHVRNKAKALSLLLGIHSIHTTTYEGSRQGLKESGKLPSYTSTELGAENTQENFLLIPNLLFSLAFTIQTLNIVATFMTYGQLLSIAPYVEVYIDIFRVLAYTEIFLKVAFLLKRQNDSLV